MNQTTDMSPKPKFKLNTTQIVTIISIILAGAGYDRLSIGGSVHEVKNEADMHEQHLTVLRERITALEADLQPVGHHEHVYPDRWSEPHPLAGNYVIPQFYQSRLCVKCKHGEMRLVE